MPPEKEKFLGELRLGRQMTSASQVAAVGLAILIGLLILEAGQLLATLGAAAPFSVVLIFLAFGLTLLSVVELLGGSGERGGSYVLVHEVLGGIVSFLTGWSVLAGSLALCAALLIGSARQLSRVIPVPTGALSLILAAGLILIQLFQILPRRIQLRSLVILLFAAVFAVLASDLPEINLDFYQIDPRVSANDFVRALAWLSSGFVAFEAVLSIRRQVRQPGKLQPYGILYTLLLGGTLMTLTYVVMVGVFAPEQTSGRDIFTVLAGKSVLPPWSFLAVIGATMLTAANGCLMVSTRELHSLAREGALPAALRRARDPFRLPPLLFLTLSVALLPLILWGTTDWLVNMANALFLAVMTVLNVVAIHSHRAEPDRRRPFELPFYPLIPVLAIGLNLILLNAVPFSGLGAAAVWLGLGAVVYLAYGRTREIEARVGEVVFGRAQQREKKGRTYRILVPIGAGEERRFTLRMATALAHQLNGEVIPLQVIEVPDPMAIEEGRRTARERNTLFEWSTRTAEDARVPFYPVTRLARSVSEGIIETAIEEDCDLILMTWTIETGRPGGGIGRVLSPVARESPCNVAVVAYEREELESVQRREREAAAQEEIEGPSTKETVPAFQPRRLVVPTAGGPNAPLATQLALLWAREFGAQVTAVYVASPDASDEELALGERRIQATIETMRKQAAGLPAPESSDGAFEDIPIEGEVVTADNVVAGIAQASERAHLVLMGASEESLIDRVLFGDIPEQVARDSVAPVLIAKRYRGLSHLWISRAWNALFEALPTLSSEQQIEVYRSVHRGARPDVDFFVMIGLSALIATYGLFQGSSAVIIGAMLVAPLFTPLLALSLAIAQGNMRLLRVAVESNVKGVALAIGLATLLALISPLKTVNPEILGRTEPNLTDLVIALASGIAGAYAIARKDVAAALPGVAIAAALVPPLGVIGIGLAIGDFNIAGGGSLLFATNLVSIVLGGSITLLLLGFRPGGHGGRDMHLRRGLTITLALFVLISIPLAAFFVQTIQESRTRRQIQTLVQQSIQEYPQLSLATILDIEIESGDREVQVTVPLFTTGEVPDFFRRSMQDELASAIDRPVSVRLIAIPMLESDP